MIVFKNFWKILLSYKTVTLIYFLVFATISILANQGNKPADQYMGKKANIAIIDQSESPLSQNLASYLAKANNSLPAPDIRDIDEQVYMGLYDAVVLIPQDFGPNPEADKIKIYSNYSSSANVKVTNDITGYMILWQIARQADGSVNYSEIEAALAQKAQVDLLVKDRPENEKDQWVLPYINASSYILIAIIIGVIGMVMLNINSPKIHFRVNCSGYSLRRFQSQIFSGQMTFGGLIWIFIVGLFFALNPDKSWRHSYLLYGLNLGVYITTIMAFTFLLTNLVKSREAISALSNVVALGTSFISGVFIPMEILSSYVVKIAQFFPTYYFVMANQAIYAKTDRWLVNMGIQALFGLVFFLVGLFIAKSRQKEGALGF